MEWIALLLLVALILAALAWAAGLRLPGLALADALVERLVCAVRLTEDCRDEPKLKSAYGADTAALLRAHAPALLYEEGMTALPIDYRRCRADSCAAGTDGVVSRSKAGEPVTAFTHVVDCRPGAAAATEERGADCPGQSEGNLYLQYWFYYPGSATAEGSTPLKGAIRKGSAALGKPTFHPDDWESYQVRIGPAGRFARASSHHGYSYELGSARLIPGHRIDRSRGRPRILRRPPVENGWGPDTDTLYVSGGSHAGNARVYRVVFRTTRDHRLRLIPLSQIAHNDTTSFAVTPPWRKRVFVDPEYGGTD